MVKKMEPKWNLKWVPVRMDGKVAPKAILFIHRIAHDRLARSPRDWSRAVRAEAAELEPRRRDEQKSVIHSNARLARELAEKQRAADEALSKVERAAQHAAWRAKKGAKDARRDEWRRARKR